MYSLDDIANAMKNESVEMCVRVPRLLLLVNDNSATNKSNNEWTVDAYEIALLMLPVSALLARICNYYLF
jgi:hypothetical protein